ncbi:MATE family efflux transporter [Clostridium sardiniense]|uniref:Probable multidrug resistance protein NorM n=1 Tax=Clostridium sardiniense TaxID=29369 RepID=A0ABS7KY73_CLOSR|nr:MATE family efflux transporter [Clostridium sardiniense]MBY0755704.1 MATE family efflux transporter [Clostridium sardiniense]MDQ0460069.1 putative MATE family efflux protein [Clostridium sardiniense]
MNRILSMDKSFYKKALIIALPIVIQNFIMSSLNIVDTMMIGKLGESEIAAVGIANQYFFLLNILMMGLFSGIGIFVSQYFGKRDEKNIKKLIGIGIIAAIVIGSIFNILAQIAPEGIISIFNKDKYVIDLGAQYLLIVSFSYIFTAITFNYGISLRCVEKSIVPMIASAIALVTNTVLNYGLIFGNFGMPELGVRGAAIATLIARIIEFLIIVAYVYISKSILAGNLKELFSFNIEFVKKIYITVMPVLLNEACWGLGSVMYNVIYGRIGTQAIASVQIATTINNLFMVIIFGMGSATLVMVGAQVGKGDEEKAAEYSKNFLVIGCIIGIIIAIALSLSANTIVSVYEVSDQVKTWSKAIIYVTSIIMVIRVYNIIAIVGVLRGGGDVKASFIIEASTMWLIGVPFALMGAFVFKLPVYLVYALCTFEEITKAIACFKRMASKKWIKNLVAEA